MSSENCAAARTRDDEGNAIVQHGSASDDQDHDDQLKDPTGSS